MEFPRAGSYVPEGQHRGVYTQGETCREEEEAPTRLSG